jgi:Ca2+/Na+ antiporter
MKKWLLPLTYPLISTASFLLIGVLAALNNGDGTGYGGAVIALCGIIFYCVIVVPAMCLIYSRHCLSGQRFRFLFTLYQSFFITLPYFIIFLADDETIIYSAILFAWCELWALLGLIRFKHKKQDQL